MSVILRCPNCGTTGGTAGECAACHDAIVRYFCTAHTPGMWLIASTCPSCGAHFDDPAVWESASAPADCMEAAAPARLPPSTPMFSRPAPSPGHDPGEMREWWPPGDAAETKPTAARKTPWRELLRAAARDRYMAPTALPLHELKPIARSIGGCLVRLVLIMLVLFLALAIALFLVGRALF